MVLCAWGALDPKTGLVSKKASLKGAEQKILGAIEEARARVFTPNRENDELTRALGNPEHPGRTRGKGVVLWYEGFSEWNTTTEAVREGRWRRSRGSRKQAAFKG